jgi:peptidoglycan/xylan/chitin deacetylase (PgdA/CDA1 family)
MFFYTIALLSLSVPMTSYSAGPAVIAKIDRHLWSESLNTPTGFDKASRAAILVYALNLNEMRGMSDAEMLVAFKIKSVNHASVMKWLDKELTLSLHNYQTAAKNCTAGDWTCIGTPSKPDELLTKARGWHITVPAPLHTWRDNLTQFVRTYLAEQMRLAALFPKVSSEIDLFNSHEWNGDDFADREFLLTFDDGPSGVEGNTDQVLAMLAAQQKSAVFFMLGSHLQNRLKKTNAANLAALYANQCVASHGWEHQSHAKWPQWQTSILNTQTLLKSVFSNPNPKIQSFVPLFRPPYGQRKADSGAFFQEQGLQVALWNLDSQDWNNHVDADDIVNRMTGLMLIKRHGVLLFHDIHPKANRALPILFDELSNAVKLRDCHQIEH